MRRLAAALPPGKAEDGGWVPACARPGAAIPLPGARPHRAGQEALPRSSGSRTLSTEGNNRPERRLRRQNGPPPRPASSRPPTAPIGHDAPFESWVAARYWLPRDGAVLPPVACRSPAPVRRRAGWPGPLAVVRGAITGARGGALGRNGGRRDRGRHRGGWDRPRPPALQRPRRGAVNKTGAVTYGALGVLRPQALVQAGRLPVLVHWLYNWGQLQHPARLNCGKTLALSKREIKKRKKISSVWLPVSF